MKRMKKRRKRWVALLCAGLLCDGLLCAGQAPQAVPGAGLGAEESAFFAEETQTEGVFTEESGEPGPPEPQEPPGPQESVKYWDSYWEEEKTIDTYTEIKESQDLTWNEGWYVAKGEVKAGEITVNGSVHLILTDGCTLETEEIKVTAGNSLSIYAQSAGENCGELISKSQNGSGIGTAEDDCGSVEIHGGKVTAIGKTSGPDFEGAGIGGAEGTVKIYGGEVQVEGVTGIRGNVVLIRNAVVTATGTQSYAIGNKHRPLTIGFLDHAVVYASTRNESPCFPQDAQGLYDSFFAVVFENGTGTVYQEVSLSAPLHIKNTETLDIGGDDKLTMNAGTVLTNEGSITVYGSLDVPGSLENNDTITVETTGSLTCTDITGTGTVAYKLAAPGNPTLTGNGPGKAMAAWGAVKNAEKYQVSFMDDSGKEESSITTEYTTEVFPVTEKEEYEVKVKAIREQRKNEKFTSVEGISNRLAFYQVAFNTNDGSESTTQFVAAGSKVTKPADPTRAGFDFAGWYKEAACTTPWDFDTDLVADDVTLYAKWTETPPEPASYTVTFHTNGGSSVETQSVTAGSKVTKPADPVRAGHTFVGWYQDSNFTQLWDFDTPVNSNMTLYAKWEEKAAPPPVIYYYTVTFETNGGSQLPPLENVREWTKIQAPEQPVREGYDFAGWYKDTACTNPWDFNAHYVTGNMTLYAKWTESTPVEPEITAPEPVEVKVTEKTADSVTIQWTEAEGAEGYTIWTRAEGETSYKRRYIHHGNEDLTYTWENKRPGKKYFFIVRAWVQDEAGAYLFSEASRTVRGTTKPLAAQIQSVTVTEEGKLKVRLAGPAKGADRYSLCWSEEENFTADHFTVGIRTSYTTRTLNKNPGAGTWYVRVKSYRDLGGGQRVYGDWSEAVRVIVKE